jgi:hypothetical protein
LPADYWQGMSDLPPSVQQALRDGDWDMPLGLFYPELINAGHLYVQPEEMPKPEDWHEYWASFDWGFAHPAACASFVRIGNVVYWLDTLYMHRFQDEEMAAAIRGEVRAECRRLVYASPDTFHERRAHTAAVETVSDIFGRYGIMCARANVDKLARAKVLRRVFSNGGDGPLVKDAVRLRVVDTVGNRRAMSELAALIPDELNPNVPGKRDANERGQHGDDGADALSFGLATPTLEPSEPLPLYRETNVSDGKAEPAPWEVLEQKYRMPDMNGRIDRREYEVRAGLFPDMSQFGRGWDDTGYLP